MQNKEAFTLIEIVVALVILGIIIFIGIEIPNNFLNKYKEMDYNSDIYSDTMIIDESIGKDIRSSISGKDILIKSSGELIDYIEIPITKISPDSDLGIETIIHKYYFKYDKNNSGIYRSVGNDSPKPITYNKFYRLETNNEDLLVLGIKEDIIGEDGKEIVDTKSKVLLKYNLINNSLQKKASVDYPLINKEGDYYEKTFN